MKVLLSVVFVILTITAFSQDVFAESCKPNNVYTPSSWVSFPDYKLVEYVWTGPCKKGRPNGRGKLYVKYNKPAQAYLMESLPAKIFTVAEMTATFKDGALHGTINNPRHWSMFGEVYLKMVYKHGRLIGWTVKDRWGQVRTVAPNSRGRQQKKSAKTLKGKCIIYIYEHPRNGNQYEIKGYVSAVLNGRFINNADYQITITEHTPRSGLYKGMTVTAREYNLHPCHTDLQAVSEKYRNGIKSVAGGRYMHRLNRHTKY